MRIIELPRLILFQRETIWSLHLTGQSSPGKMQVSPWQEACERVGSQHHNQELGTTKGWVRKAGSQGRENLQVSFWKRFQVFRKAAETLKDALASFTREAINSHAKTNWVNACKVAWMRTKSGFASLFGECLTYRYHLLWNQILGKCWLDGTHFFLWTLWEERLSWLLVHLSHPVWFFWPNDFTVGYKSVMSTVKSRWGV